MKKFARLISLVMAVSLALMMVAMAGACNHVWTKWTTKIPPTCLEEGEQESSCDKPNCGKHAYRAVAKLDHLYVPATCTQKKHCVNGCDDEYTDATCQKPATCKRCGDETGGKANHSFPKVSCTMVAKCRWCEKKQRGEHQWVTEGKERTCSVCQISQALKQPKPDPEYTE